jgi:hypothetical protein
MVTTITHSEISTVTAAKLGKDYSAESVGNTVKEYASSLLDLMKEKGPTSTGDKLLVETPLVGYCVDYHESGVKRNADGTEEKIGANRTIKTAIPNKFIEGINADLIKLAVNVGKAVIGAIKKAA